MRRAAIGSGVVVLLLIGLWFALRYRESETAPKLSSSAPASAPADHSAPGQPTLASAQPPAAPAPRRASSTRRDRKQRDAMRARIYAAFGQPLPEAQLAKAPRPQGLAPGRPGLSKDYIQERIREDFVPMARECYEAALEHTPDLAGKVVMAFEIVGDESVGGVVESAELGEGSTLDDQEFNTCMRESMLSMLFEPPEGGGSVRVNYPILFDPGDAGPQAKDASTDAG